MGRSRHHHSLSWRVGKAIEHAGVRQPFMSRTGPAWMFGLMGVGAELVLAPVVMAITLGVGIASYLLLDAPWTRVRAQQRPRFVSVRILYLNTLIVAGFWLAVMFTFSAADPAVSGDVQRLPVLLDIASTRDLAALIDLQRSARSQPVIDVGSASTWFDVFLHGLVSAIALNFLLYAIVIARRRLRSRQSGRAGVRKTLRYDAIVGLFVDDDPNASR